MSDETEQTFFLAIGPMCWGRGYTRRQALEACRESWRGGSARAGEVAKAKVFESNSGDLYVDGMGRVHADAMYDGHEVTLDEVGEYPLGLPLGDDHEYRDELDALARLIECVDNLDVATMIRRLNDVDGDEFRESLQFIAGDVEDLRATCEDAERAGLTWRKLKEPKRAPGFGGATHANRGDDCRDQTTGLGQWEST